MAFQFRLEDKDGSPAEPPVLRTAVSAWKPGDTIPLGRGGLRVVAVRPGDDDGNEVLIVEDA